MLPVANNTISAFNASSYPNVTRVSSESVVLQEPHPQFNHRGGTIAAPGGLLYVSIGNPLMGKTDERKPEREVYASTSSTGKHFVLMKNQH